MSQRPAADAPACRLEVELPTVAENLALDEALLAEAHEGLLTGPVVRTWMAARPTAVLGSSSRVAEEVDLDACRARGVDLVRRPSGGLTVVLGPGCVMWSVVAAVPEPPPSIDRIHALVLDPLAAAITAAGRPVVRRGSSDLTIHVDGVDRKVSGNALRLRRGAVLYHGTLLDDFDLDLVALALRHPPREPAYRAGRSHAAFLSNLGLGRAVVEAAVGQAFGATARRLEWPRDRVTDLVRRRYGDVSWTHRVG